jgi:hypothetical protein
MFWNLMLITDLYFMFENDQFYYKHKATWNFLSQISLISFYLLSWNGEHHTNENGEIPVN